MAPPMPPLAPVTRAFRPVRSNMESLPVRTAVRRQRVGSFRRARSAMSSGVSDGDAAHRRDALDEAGQHLAGADLDERVDAGRRHGQASHSRQRTVPVTCCDERRRGSRRIGDRRGRARWRRAARRRLDRRPPPAPSRIASAAGCISAQWKGADTGSSMARLAPRPSGHRSRARPPPCGPRPRPGPPPLSLAASQTSSLRRLRGDLLRAARVQRRAAPPWRPTPTGTAFCMASPRSAAAAPYRRR